MFPGVAKTDGMGAEAMAPTGAGVPWAPRPVAEESEATASPGMLASRREFALGQRTQAKNRLGAVLLELDPAFETAVDLFRAVAERACGASREASSALWGAAASSAAPGRPELDAECPLVRMLAAQVVGCSEDAALAEAAIAGAPAGVEAYRCLLTVPGIGPRTAAALVTRVGMSPFRSHDELASCCGVAPANSRSGTGPNSTRPGRGGNESLENLPVFSCNSFVGTGSRFGRCHEDCRARGMRHNKALRAVARKRVRVIHPMMRDPRPYEERPSA